MTLRACAGCGRVKPGKPVSIYAAWNNGGERNSWRGNWCYQCAGVEFGALMTSGFDPNDDTIEMPTTCCICGEELDTDPAMTSASVFRGDTRATVQWLTCAGCAQQVRAMISKGAEPLESRPSFSGNGDGWGRPQPSPTIPARGGLPW